MNIVVLTRKPSLYFNQKLDKLAKEQGFNVSMVDPLECELIIDGQNSRLYYHSKPLDKPDVVIPRMSNAVLEFGTSVIKHFELLDVPIINSSPAIINSINRYEYLQLLAGSQNVKTTRAVLIRKSSQVKQALKLVNGPPAMLKMISANNNLGAMLIENNSTIESLFDVNMVMGGFGQIGQNIIIEEFIREATGKSLHILVLNGEAIGAFHRFKSLNLKQSLSTSNKPNFELTEPTQECYKMAVDATVLLGLDFALVGILESNEEPKVFEININPDIEIFETRPEFNVIPKILALCVQKVQKQLSVGVENV